MTIKSKLLSLKQELPSGCTLVAVSKTHPEQVILEAYEAGHRVFGENKVQELLPKYETLPKDIEWHLIGHLQTNKVKYIAPFVKLIQSVDSEKLLQEIDKQAKKAGRVISCLLQIYIADEESKFGFSPDELTMLMKSDKIAALHNIQVTGLMGMATLTPDVAQIRNEFENLRKIFETLKTLELPPNIEMKELSIGMSSDYKIAIESGSTMVRVGSAIFGNRDYQQNV
jgi:PLP dependent protein